jgi:hypothetical protein
LLTHAEALAASKTKATPHAARRPKEDTVEVSTA